jgi:hypothetical protein
VLADAENERLAGAEDEALTVAEDELVDEETAFALRVTISR